MSFDLLAHHPWGQLRAVDALILLRLADRADKQGICWPGYDSLARDCQLSRRQVMRSAKRLADDGWIEKLMLPGDKIGFKVLTGARVLRAVGGDCVSPVTAAAAKGQIPLPGNGGLGVTVCHPESVTTTNQEPVTDQRARARKAAAVGTTNPIINRVLRRRGLAQS